MTQSHNTHAARRARAVPVPVAIAVLAALSLAMLLLVPGSGARAIDGSVVLHSYDMNDNGPLNPMFSCSAYAAGPGTPPGGTTSPELTFSPTTAGLAAISSGGTFALIMHDEFGADQDYDAPGDWAHWGIYNMTSTSANPQLARGASGTAGILGGTEIMNSWGSTGYNGPCPPGGTHTYYFTVYVLDAPLQGAIVTAADLTAALAGHVVEQGDLQVTARPIDIGTSSALVEFSPADLGIFDEGFGVVANPSLIVNGVIVEPTSVTASLTDTSCGASTAATFNDDYTYAGVSRTTVVTIPAGTYDGTSFSALDVLGTVTLIDDSDVEGTECLHWVLSDATGDVSIGDAAHSGINSASQGRVVSASIATLTDNEPSSNSVSSEGGLAETGVGLLATLFWVVLAMLLLGTGSILIILAPMRKHRMRIMK